MNIRWRGATARATRETTTTDPATTAKTAADALLQLWPDLDHNTTDLIDALRTNATTLTGNTGDLL